MSIYRNTVFLIKGMTEFSKSGYEKAAKKFTPGALDVDVSEKVFMVTGASSGLGKAVAIDLAKRGGTVHMVCRNPTKGEEVRQEIIKLTNNEKVHLHIADLSIMADITRLAQDFKQNHKRLDVLVNNGGGMTSERKKTKEGIESNFALNTLGTFHLTMSLLDILSASKPSRVVTVASGGMYTQRLNVEDLEFEKMNPFDEVMAYAQNKRQQVILTEMWQKKYESLGITFYSCHPGWADTPGVREAMPGFYDKLKDVFRTVEQGADTITYLSVAKDIEKKVPPASFVQDRESVSKHLTFAWTTNPESENELLWKRLEEYIEKAKKASGDSNGNSQKDGEESK